METLLATLKALGDATRLRLVDVLQSGAFNVNELVGILGVGQSRVSRHLKILLDAGLVDARREGTWVYYTLSEEWSGQGNGERPRRFLRLLAREIASGDPGARTAIESCLLERRRRSEEFFRDVAETWDAHRDSLQGSPVHLLPLVEAVGRAGTVVDLGTGTGVLLARLSPLAERVIGIDSSEEMLQVARRKVAEEGLPNVELRLGSLEHLPVPDAEANAMVANMVLHHVARPPDALREVHRGLCPGGRLVLADFEAHGQESYREQLGDLWLGFERRDLERWLDATEFDVEHARRIPGEGGRPAVMLFQARRR